MRVITNYISSGLEYTQMDLMYFLFEDFMNDEASINFNFDNGQVNRWLKGNAKISPKISGYYMTGTHKSALKENIQRNIVPIIYDEGMAAESLYTLVMNDITISQNERMKICTGCESDIAAFISKALLFSMERSFIKRDIKMLNLTTDGSLSPVVSDYIFDGCVPKPCKYFCGRESELIALHDLLNKESKVFVQGIAGIGKSEFVKKYAAEYKKQYTNILYFTYTGSLKQMITDCDFADDIPSDIEDLRLKKHNRFLRSLKEDINAIAVDKFEKRKSS
ncbi:MAG: hypothetical protein ACI4DP_03295 [Candidatus Ornithomonoglobus sp.]